MRKALLPKMLLALMVTGVFLTFGLRQGSAAVASTEMGGHHRIAVVGVGRVSVPEESPTIYLSVESQAGDVTTAQSEGTRAFNRLQTALAGIGVAKDDVVVHSLRIGQTAPTHSGSAQKFRYMEVVSVHLAKSQDLSRALDTALRSGATSVHGVRYDVTGSAQQRAKAYKLAVANARTKAQELAAAMGVRLGAPISISLIDHGHGHFGSSGSALAVKVRVLYRF